MYVTLLVVIAAALLAALLWAATRGTGAGDVPREPDPPPLARSPEHWPLVASCGIGTWIWHVNTGAIEWDAAMCGLFDVPASAAPRTLAHFTALLPPLDRTRFGDTLTALANAGGLLDTECTIEQSNRTLSVLATRAAAHAAGGGEALRVIGVCQDITRRRELEAQNKEHARLAQFYAAIGAALIEKGTLEAMVGKCAAAMSDHLDVAVSRIWTVDDAGAMLELKASAGLSLDLGPRRVPVDHFTNGVMADEAWIAREGLHGFGGYPLLVDDRLVGVLTMFSRAGLSHATLTALAIAAKQVALGIERKKADVVGYLAHDFNNLLTAIGVCVDLLKSRLAQGSLERHYVDDIDIAATRAADLTRLLQAVGGKTP